MARQPSPYRLALPLLGFMLTLCSLSVGAATFIVANLNDSGPGSLRQAILDANATAGNDTVVFQNSLSGTITLTSGEFAISSNLAINGPGADVLAVSGNKAWRIFTINLGASVTIEGLTLEDGATSDSGGGAIYNDGSALTVNNSILSANTAFYGGGIYNDRGTVTLYNSVLNNNSAITGGGIYNNDGILAISNSTLNDNSASSFGGGIFNTGAMTIINNTLSGNSTGYSGGGICNIGTATIINSTLSGNLVTNDGQGGGGTGGGIESSGPLQLGNSLMSSNTALAGKEIFLYNAANFISQGHNLIGENGVSGVEGATLAASDIVPTVGISAILAPLGDYGGLTQTHLLVPGSPAINAGDIALIPAGVTTDQRGFPRIQDGTVDIGAMEVGSATDIPTLNQWALLLGGGLVVGMALLVQVRRTRPPRG